MPTPGFDRNAYLPDSPRMPQIINLNRARKAKARDEAATQAAHNRAKFGRTRTERQAADREQAKAAIALDGKRLEP